MSTHQVDLALNEAATLPSGASLQILSGTGFVDVEIIYNGQLKNNARKVPVSYYYRPNETRLDQSGLAFTQVRIVAAYGPVSMLVDISDSDSGTNILAGDVNVSNLPPSDLEDVQAGREFQLGYELSVGSGSYAHFQLFNPAASGKELILNSAKVFGYTATWLRFYLATPVELVSALGGGFNLANGLRDGVAVMRYRGSSTTEGGQVDSVGRRYYVSQGGPLEMIEKPIVIPQGQGVVVRGDVGKNFGVEFQWSEIDA